MFNKYGIEAFCRMDILIMTEALGRSGYVNYAVPGNT